MGLTEIDLLKPDKLKCVSAVSYSDHHKKVIEYLEAKGFCQILELKEAILAPGTEPCFTEVAPLEKPTVDNGRLLPPNTEDSDRVINVNVAANDKMS